MQNILVIWSSNHEHIAYRQGMHELAGTILYVVEAELAAWIDPKLPNADKNKLKYHPLKECFKPEFIEPYAFWLFDRIMVDMGSLYDPTSGPDGNPPIVSYCAQIQGLFNVFFLLIYFCRNNF